MKPMKFLFFDCECANCYNHEGKICSFGYVITDTSFSVLESKDLIINPDAPFDPHVLGVGANSIDLAYSPIRFTTAEKFPFFFPTIAGLLTDQETMVFGYAIDNDIGFLLSECRRYKKEMPLFLYHDIQEIYRVYDAYERSPSLEDALKGLKIPFDDFEGHESKDDAVMSMLVLKGLLLAKGTDLKGLLDAYPSATGHVRLNLLQAHLDALPVRYDVPFNRDVMRDFNLLTYSSVDEPLDNKLDGYGFLFSPTLKKDAERSLPLAHDLIAHRGLVIRNLREASYYLVRDGEEKEAVEPLFADSSIVVLTPEETRDLFE